MNKYSESFLITCVQSEVQWFTVNKEYWAVNDPIDGTPLIVQDDFVSDLDYEDAWEGFRNKGTIIIDMTVIGKPASVFVEK